MEDVFSRLVLNIYNCWTIIIVHSPLYGASEGSRSWGADLLVGPRSLGVGLADTLFPALGRGKEMHAVPGFRWGRPADLALTGRIWRPVPAVWSCGSPETHPPQPRLNSYSEELENSNTTSIFGIPSVRPSTCRPLLTVVHTACIALAVPQG